MSQKAVRIDIEHLDHQTMGDRELRLEILKLYRHQARLSLCRLESAATADEFYEIAHTLKGASLGIGAVEVAQAARSVEESARAVPHSKPDTVVLQEAIHQTLCAIEELTEQS